MMKRVALWVLAAGLSVPALAAPAPGLAGTWKNASDSVRIRIAPCSAAMCGTVIAADAKSRADAARGGTDNLVGTQLFRDFRKSPDGGWQGEVFVPDLNVAVSGTLTLSGRDTLSAAGCLFQNFGCKTQTWTRVK